MALHILGIRHHGVGSSRMLKQRLDEIKPDLILVEGPPEISELLVHIGNSGLVPPVAVILYDENKLERSSFYPFAEYSPEWIAAKYANKKNIPVRALDLPASISFAIQDKEDAKTKEVEQESVDSNQELQFNAVDPISFLAEIAGYESGESWWDSQFESLSKRNAEEHFNSTHLAMKTLRDEGLASSLDEENVHREAYMRQIIRSAQNEMYQNIAVVCGAWHGPALEDIDDKEKADNKIIKSLPKSKVKIGCSRIPWTNGRLSRFSGYGAGITSPGWYEHQWHCKSDLEVNWLSRVATIFREEKIDISTAHVLETYRLSHALAKLRDHSLISFKDLNDSIRTVMCNGDDILFELVKKQLIIDEKIGRIPDDIPKVPLQQDFESLAKTLRLKFSAMPKTHSLDLRKPLDLKRSVFFHRLLILGITWAKRKTKRSKGTFKEVWELIWDPNMQIELIDKANYGNTIQFAAENFIKHQLENENSISEFVKYIEFCVPAELFKSMDDLLFRINQETSISNDIKDLMISLPKLIQISRYGDVRKTDVEQIEHIVERLYYKIDVSLANTCYGLDEENSSQLFNLIGDLDRSLKLVENDEIIKSWKSTLRDIINKDGIHMVIKGCTIRLLFDYKEIAEEELSQLLSFYLSPIQDAVDVAHWVEGFLRGSGLILIYDNKIWNLIYHWVSNVNYEQFIELLPVLRRAFSKFPFGERRQIGQKAKSGLSTEEVFDVESIEQEFDHERGAEILPFIAKYLIGGDGK